MIDTIGVRFRTKLRKELVERWETKRGNGRTYEKYFLVGTRAFYAVYHSYSWDKSHAPMLNIRLSLPKLLYGCNHVILASEHLSDALDRADACIHSVSEFANLPSVREAQLVRFDPCYNFHVGSDMPYYLYAGKLGEYPRHTKNVYATGFSLGSSITSIRGYDKGAECGHPAAEGYFRLEISVHNSRHIRRLLDKDTPTILDLPAELPFALLEKALSTLGLNDRIMCSEPKATVRITAQFPTRKALVRNLIHYAHDRNVLPAEALKQRYSRAIIRKYEKLLGEAGVSSAFLSENRVLPPLRIERQKRP